MDPDDEVSLERLERSVETEQWHSSLMGRLNFLKLYQSQESNHWNSMVVRFIESDGPINWNEDYSAFYRCKRFFASIKGFHSGSLDLTGRHEGRYCGLLSQWNEFLRDCSEVSQNSSEVMIPLTGSDDEPLYFRDEEPPMVKEDVVSDPEIEEKFRKRWKLRTIPLSLLFQRTSKVAKYLSEHPIPKFQIVSLQNLPTELIHQIMQEAELDGSRRLGSTSKYYREIALLYIYKSRTFDVPFNPNWGLYRNIPESEQWQYMVAEAQRARDVLVDELDFVISRPNITGRILQIDMFGFHCGIARALFDREDRLDEFIDMLEPVHTRLAKLFQKIKNVKRLHLVNVSISEGAAQDVSSLPFLQDVTITCCSLSGDLTLPPCPSVINAGLDLNTGSHLSTWAFLKSWVNLRSLYIHKGTDLDTFDPEAAFRTTCNPFRVLERLRLERVDWDDIEIMTSWLQASPELKLTHFKLEVGNRGLSFARTREILVGLHRAPLRVLILNGLRFMRPLVIDLIATSFPNLLSLSILYRDSWRQTKCKRTAWPNPSWEYASKFQHLRHLEFFGWNFGVEVYQEVFAFTLQSFEEGFREGHWETPWEETLTGEDSLVRLLAAYCPTLRCVAFLPRGERCYISRTESGGIVLNEELCPFETGEDVPSFSHHWKVQPYR